jgi:hypothetical protein
MIMSCKGFGDKGWWNRTTFSLRMRMPHSGREVLRERKERIGCFDGALRPCLLKSELQSVM